MKGIKNSICIIVVLWLTVFRLSAQVVDARLLDAYNPGVFAKVFDVASKVILSPEQIYQLAARFNSKDSMVADWIVRGKLYSEIDSLDASASSILHSVLSERQLYLYAQAKGNLFAKAAATGELEYINETYKPDTGVYKGAENMLVNKYTNIFAQYLTTDGNEKTFAERTKLPNKNYDLYNLYPTLYSKTYVDGFISKIAAARPIPDSTIEKIKSAFHAQAYYAKYDDWGNVLDRVTRWYLTDTAVYSSLHHAEFDKQAFELSAADSYNLIYLNRVSKNDYDAIYYLVREKNYTKVLLQYTYAYAHFKTFDSLMRKVTQYYDSAVEASLLRVGALQPTTQFAIALKYKNIIGFDPALTDTILYHAMYLAKQRDSILNADPFAVVDFGAYEAQVLGSLLTDGQYDLLLSFKNKYQALADAKSDWAEMELRGITSGFNKDETISQISGYYLAKYNAWNRFAYDKIKQWATVDAMGNNKPQALKLLDPIRWSGNTQKPTNNLRLKW